jgi:DNA topoisomerase-1
MTDLFEALSDADDADLYYVSDEQPGIVRRRRGRGFSYHHPDGTPVDVAERERIEAIVIPPAWREVWICPLPDGHVQATGRDERGRKQYRYHPRWREVRDANKFARLAEFGTRLPELRARVDDDLARPGLPAEKVLAAVVRLLDETLVRVGNDEYAVANGSFGITTLEADHAEIEGDRIALDFRGKSGVEQAVSLRDRRLARIVAACQELPGEDLFGYLDEDGRPVDVTSTMVNDHLRALCGEKITAKHFRTWGGTVVAAGALMELPPPGDEKEATSNELAALDLAAGRLGNTRTVCRNCYVHPQVTDAYRDGSLHEAWRRSRRRSRFSRAEAATLAVLGDRA